MNTLDTIDLEALTAVTGGIIEGGCIYPPYRPTPMPLPPTGPFPRGTPIDIKPQPPQGGES